MDLEGKRYKLTIWDTAGQERFRTLTSSYYRGAQGVILVYDVTNRATFDQLDVWFKELDTYATHKEVVKMVVGNKVDKESDRVVSLEEGQALAEEKGALFCECSAKTRLGILAVMEQLVGKVSASFSFFISGGKGEAHTYARDTHSSPPIDHRNTQSMADQEDWKIHSTSRPQGREHRYWWFMLMLREKERVRERIIHPEGRTYAHTHTILLPGIHPRI